VKSLWVLACAGGLLVAAAAAAGAQTGVMDGVQQSYQLASHTWSARLIPIAQRTLPLIAAIEVFVSALIYGFRRDALDDIAARFVLKFMLLGVVLAAVTYSGTWLPVILNGFAAAGERATGQTGTVNPGDVIDIGVQVAGSMLAIFDGWGIIQHPVIAIYSAICGDLVLLCYAFVAAQLLLVVVEGYFAVGMGALILVFAAFRGTAGYAEGFLNYIVHLGIKIFLMYLVVGIGADVSRSWVPLLTPDHNFGAGSPIWQVFGGVLVFAIMTYRIPNTVASRITSSWSFGLSAALRAL
jgi:type IV secretion system protein TrbL